MKKIRRFFLKLFLVLIIIVSLIMLCIFGSCYLKKEKLYKIESISQKINNIENNNSYIKLDSVSDNFKNAIVAIEDHRFYNHSGFDLISFSRAFFVNLKTKEFSQGGSTITQQLAKRLYLTADKNIFRKITELLIAFDLEKFLEKDKILELYINSIYYGNSSTGIYNASLNYFNKPPNNLTDNEAAFLAGLPQAPSIYSKNKDLAEKRKKEVLDAVAKYNNKK